MTLARVFLIGASLLLLALPAHSQTDPVVQGMSEARLQHVYDLMRDEVDSGQVPSASAIVARNGEIVFERYYGTMGGGQSVGPGTIMRMASIGKTVTAVTILTLYEEGLLSLDDAVAEYLPSFADVKVREREPSSGQERLVEPDGSVTIRQLLTQTAGLQRHSDEVNDLWGTAATVKEFADGIAALPLRHQPGAGFAYGNAYEVLAAVAEAASGERFDRLVRSRVLDPLRMNDTYFFVPDEKLDRLSAMYSRDADDSLVTFRKRGEEEPPSVYFSGGGGLRGTIRDYYRFASMLLNGGELEGVRILSPKTVRLMTRDQVGADLPGAWTGDWGWGFGLAVRRRVQSGDVGTSGAFGWNGGTGTWYFVDPKEHLIGLIFTQLNPGNPYDLRESFERAVYFSIVESYARSEDG